jgi:hypothetical protein
VPRSVDAYIDRFGPKSDRASDVEFRRRAGVEGHPRAPVNVYDASFDLHSDWYTAPTEEWVVAVFDPSLGFSIGGGTIIHNGFEANFAFSVKYQKNKTGAQGNFIYIEDRPTGEFKVKSNSLKSLSIVGGTIIVETKNATANGVGGYNARFVGVDNGPGSTDQFGMTLYDSSNAVVPGEDFSGSPATLTGGNIQAAQNPQ